MADSRELVALIVIEMSVIVILIYAVSMQLLNYLITIEATKYQ